MITITRMASLDLMTQLTPNDIHTNVKETVEKRILFTRSSSMQEISRVKHASYYLYKTYSIWFFLSRSTLSQRKYNFMT